MSRPSLIEAIQGLLERTYRMPRIVDDVGRFLIGDRGYRSLYDGKAVVAGASPPAASSARTLVRETGSEIRACIYLPDALIETLEVHPPQRGLDEWNVDAFAVLVEELDHLLCIAERAQEGRAVSLFELELHANVSKHLVLARFLAGPRRAIGPAGRAWLRYHLFHKGSVSGEHAEATRRYRDAARWALRFVDGLERKERAERLETLRRFHGAPIDAKLDLIRELAAA